MNRTEFILRQISKTNKKSYENYVVTRIWHLLNDLTIKIVTQQHVTRPAGRALTDLYFPQIKLHIEIDEGHHFNEGEKVAHDLVREADIISATKHKLKTIKVCEDCYDIDISLINKRIDELVEEIRAEFKSKNPPAWDIDSENNPQTYIDKGSISANEEVAFRTMADACNCFGNNYKGLRKCFVKHPVEDKYLWFPKLYRNEGWENSISLDESEIFFKKIEDNDAWFKENIGKQHEKKEKLVFASVRSILGDTMYRFKGVYKTDMDESKRKGFVLLRRTSLKTNTYPPLKVRGSV